MIGCGNSSIEIAGELKLSDPIHNNVTILVRNGRYFTKKKVKQRFEVFLDKICTPSPFSDKSILNDNLIPKTDIKFHESIIQFDRFTEFLLFTNLEKYNIKKPLISSLADHYYNNKLTVVDKHTIDLIKSNKISIINNEIDSFIPNGIQFKNGDIKDYDIIILGTGYRHNLENLFDKNLWYNELSTLEHDFPRNMQDNIDPKILENLPTKRQYLWPKTNTYSRSIHFDSLYFAGFDYGYLGGLTIGLYSWGIGEEISVKLGKMDINDCEIPWIKDVL